MKINKIYITALAALSLTATSCSDFLDRADTNGSYVSNGFFQSEQALYDGAMGVYNKMYMNNIAGFYLVPAVTIFDHLTPLLLERTENTTIGAGPGLNPANTTVQSVWSNCYTGIARANEVISGSEAYKPTFSQTSLQYLSEVRALRAYYYYVLIGLFGDVPFFTAPVTNDEYDTAVRTPREKIIDFLIDDLKDAALALPWKRSEVGRVNRGFAYAMITRLGLLGGSLDIGGKSATYFKAAVDAGKEVIDNGGYNLASSYEDLFTTTGQLKADVRDEIFYELPYTSTATSKITHQIGYGQASRIQGQTGRHVSQMLYDTYECIDGKRIDESPLYDNAHPQLNRDPRLAANLRMDGDEMTVNNGTTTIQLISCYNTYTSQYSYATGLWNHALLNIDKDGASASWASFCNAGNGILNAKYTYDLAEGIQASSIDIPVIRYAELLLNYAEAKIELNDLDASVYNAMNLVRRRAGMPDVSDDRKGNQSKMRQLVRRERKVEFATEGLHIFDMRRWKTGDIENMYPSYGCPLIEYQYQAGNKYDCTFEYELKEDGNEDTSKPVLDENGYPVIKDYKVSLGLAPTDIPVFKAGREDENDIPCYDAYKQKLKVRDLNRYWDARFELWPIPTEELNRTKNITQNPGY